MEDQWYATPEVRVIAAPMVMSDVLRSVDFYPESSWLADADDLAEFAGRLCYKSFHRPNPATATNREYLAHIQEVAHESIFGHATFSLLVTGVSRALLLELERHAEHMNINLSVVSQRYVDHSDSRMVMPPELVPHLDEPYDNTTVGDYLQRLHLNLLDEYAELNELLSDAGLPRKAARGAARAVLPEATETQFVLTLHLRAARDIIRKRISPAADAEIREFARLMLQELMEYAPNSLQDLEYLLHVVEEE